MTFGGESSAGAAPRLFLRLDRKRRRLGESDRGSLPKYVRVQWSETEMGDVPPALRRVVKSETNLIFRRLTGASLRPVEELASEATIATPEATTPLSLSSASASSSSYNAAEKDLRSGSAYVQGLWKTKRSVWIDCGSEALRTSGEDGGCVSSNAGDLFVLDEAASEADAMTRQLADFSIGDEEEESLKAVPHLNHFKRRRSGSEELPVYFLRPVPRQDANAASRAAERNVGHSLSVSQWGAVQEDVDDLTMNTLHRLEGEDGDFCVGGSGDAAADLYVYPDHRKDDEYDSNAEDFSGNDYPDDADDALNQWDNSRDGRSDNDAEEGSAYGDGGGSYTQRPSHYGMFYEEGYNERELSSGWESES